MLTVEECRQRAAEWLQRAESASDVNTRASLGRAAEEWSKLADHVEKHSLPLRPLGYSANQGSNPAEQPALISEAGAKIGDALRERLHLFQFDNENPDVG